MMQQVLAESGTAHHVRSAVRGPVLTPGLVLLLVACTRLNPAYEGGAEDTGGSDDKGSNDGEGSNEGDSNDGGSNEGGSNEGGSNEGGSNDGGSNEGGSNDGDSNDGGSSGGGSSGGSNDPCDSNNGGCTDQASCTPAGEGVECECNPGFTGDGFTCEPVSLRVELPCSEVMICGSSACGRGEDNVDAVLTGDVGSNYEITLHVRGVVELQEYAGGRFFGWYSEGGAPGGGVNVFVLLAGNPPTTYYLNAGDGEQMFECVSRDHMLTITVPGGSTLSLSADALDPCGLENFGGDDMPIVVPGIPPAPEPFEGQFLQLDIVDSVVVK
jgi:hypothetical protein